jgi:hypothetical protein
MKKHRIDQLINAVLLLALLLGAPAAPARPARAAGDLYVSKTGADAGGCSQASPCLTITYAVSQAADGDTIHIGGGTYTEAGIVVNGSLNFIGAGTADPPTGTWVDGAGSGRVFLLNNSGSTSSFSNMVITGGAPANYTTDNSANGGGILAEGALELDNVVLIDNQAYYGGGAYAVEGAVVSNSRIESNHAWGDRGADRNDLLGGGGMRIDGPALITGTDFIANVSECVYANDPINCPNGGGAGAGLALYSTSTITSSRFISNTGMDTGWAYGGAIATTQDLVISGTQVLSNTAAYGGGIYALGRVALANSLFRSNHGWSSASALHTNDSLVVTDTQFINNQAAFGTGAVQVRTSATLRDTLFEGNQALAGDVGAMNVDGDLVMDNTIFRLNSAGSSYGALQVWGYATIRDSQFLSNTGEMCGALHVDVFDTLISGTLFQGNRAVNGDSGALYSDASLRIINSQFVGNQATYYGGALLTYGTDFNLINTSFISNTSDLNSGAIELYVSSTTITGSLFLGNQAGTYAGAGTIRSPALITNTRFINNSAAPTENAGALKFTSSDASTLVNTVFASNDAQTGGAVSMEGSGTVNILHSTIGHAGSGAGAAVEVLSGQVYITDTILANYDIGVENIAGTVSSAYNLYYNTLDKSGTIDNGAGDITGEDPLFFQRAGNDLRLAAGSPALWAGTDAGVTRDILGELRLSPPTIGAYEFPISTDASLVDLALSSGVLSPAFISTTLDYTATVAFSVTSLTVTPTANEPHAAIQVRVNGGSWSPVASGSPSGPLDLNLGDNLVEILVTAQDGTTTATYTVTVSRLENDARLRDLALSDGVLAPAFISTTLDYTATVAFSVTTVTVTPTANEPHAAIQVRVNGGSWSPVASGSPSGPLDLNLGGNLVEVLVTAQDGSTAAYTVTVQRVGSSDAGLVNLALSKGTLVPAFATGTLDYTVRQFCGVSSMTVTPTASEPHAAIQVRSNGGGWSPVNSGQASSPLPLRVGQNLVEVQVTAQDGTPQVYTLSVTRADRCRYYLIMMIISYPPR